MGEGGAFRAQASEFQTKDVVNVSDGRRLGQVHDLELDVVSGRVQAIIVPSGGRWFGLWGGGTNTSSRGGTL